MTTPTHPLSPPPGVSTRILLIGDSHGDFRFIGRALETAQSLGITTAIQLGDFGIWPGQPGRNFLDAVSLRASQAGITLYAFTGNHDDQDQIAHLEANPDPDGFITLRPSLRWVPRAHRWTWHGVHFGALGGAYSIDHRQRIPGVDLWPGAEEVHPADIDRLGTAPLDVLLTHDAPEGAQPRSIFTLPEADIRASRYSRELLLQAVDATRPKLVVHGHWHARNQTYLEIGEHGQVVRVEGLAADVTPRLPGWGVLDLADLSFTALSKT
jgi:predicted phosphodiesterase